MRGPRRGKRVRQTQLGRQVRAEPLAHHVRSPQEAGHTEIPGAEVRAVRVTFVETCSASGLRRETGPLGRWHGDAGEGGEGGEGGTDTLS